MAEDTIKLELTTREVTGKAVKKLRRQGQVPAVIHDHGRPSVHVMGNYQDVVKTYRLAGKHHAVDLKAGDKTFTALIKNVDIDPKKNQLRHVVFNAVNKNQKVEAEVPVAPRYDGDNESSPAERAGLIVLTNLESVEIKALPSKIPNELTYDAEKLVEVGNRATVADLDLPEGVEMVTELEHAIATVYEPSAIAAANDEAAGTAEAADAGEVESEHESGAAEETQKDEPRPGGKKENEDKSQGRSPEKQ